jgi:amino acid transporter/CBS domain-containing protein
MGSVESTPPTAKEDLKRQLTFRDVFFLSFGGSSPLLSLLTYGAVALLLGGYLAPIILLAGTMIVLVNGLVVQRMASRFTTSGGYYTYAFRMLSERAGFQTGWMYMFYAVLFGSAYVVGATYVLNYVFAFPPVLVVLGVTTPAFVFLLLGVRPSAKYAIWAGVVEVALMAGFFFYALYVAHFTFYSPISYASGPTLSAGTIALAILFAMGIPTGYGSIAPLSGEILNASKVVGRVMVSVILVSGLLAALFVYALANTLVAHGANILTVSSGAGLPVINILNSDFGTFGKYFTLILAVGVISDGILAILSFDAAGSRTLFRMGLDGTFPKIFSARRDGQPIVANLAVGAASLLISVLTVIFLSPSVAFVALGATAAFGNLFIHLAANFSLLRAGLRAASGSIYGGLQSLGSSLSGYGELTLASVAIAVTVFDLLFSMLSTALIYVTFFLGWIVIGYLLADVKEIAFRTPFVRARSLEDQMQVPRELTAIEIRKELPDVTVKSGDRLKVALRKCIDLDSPGAIVLDSKGRPVGTILLSDIINLGLKEYDNDTVGLYALTQVATVNADDSALEVAAVFKESKLPILAIVNNSGMFMGTLRERELVRRIASFHGESDSPAG